MASRARVQVWRTGGQWYGHKLSGNNRNVGPTGEGYNDKRGVRRWAAREHPGLPVYDTTNGKPGVLLPPINEQ